MVFRIHIADGIAVDDKRIARLYLRLGRGLPRKVGCGAVNVLDTVGAAVVGGKIEAYLPVCGVKTDGADGVALRRKAFVRSVCVAAVKEIDRIFLGNGDIIFIDRVIRRVFQGQILFGRGGEEERKTSARGGIAFVRLRRRICIRAAARLRICRGGGALLRRCVFRARALLRKRRHRARKGERKRAQQYQDRFQNPLHPYPLRPPVGAAIFFCFSVYHKAGDLSSKFDRFSKRAARRALRSAARPRGGGRKTRKDFSNR